MNKCQTAAHNFESISSSSPGCKIHIYPLFIRQNIWVVCNEENIDDIQPSYQFSHLDFHIAAMFS